MKNPAPVQVYPWRDTLVLLRIPFSLLLLPVFLFALAQAPAIVTAKAWGVFGILHLLIYPASNGYNSYVDRDEESIGGIKQPPPPPPQLYWVTLALDLLGVGLSLFIQAYFALGVGFCVLLSRAYSAEWPRLKRYPIVSFLTVFFFQGAFVFWTVLLGITPPELQPELFSLKYILLGLGASCLIGGAYPLSQIYQHESDAARGDLTLSRVLGHRGTLVFCALLYAVGGLLLALSLSPADLLVLTVFLMPVGAYFSYWTYCVFKDPSAADYAHTMRMNGLAASCVGLGFLMTWWF